VLLVIKFLQGKHPTSITVASLVWVLTWLSEEERFMHTYPSVLVENIIADSRQTLISCHFFSCFYLNYYYMLFCDADIMVHHFHEFIRVANLCSGLCYCITTQFVTAQLLWLWCLSLDNIQTVTMLTAVPLVCIQ